MKGKLIKVAALLICLCFAMSTAAYALGDDTPGITGMGNEYTDSISDVSGAHMETGYINVMDFGAKADGIADDSGAVKRAFNDAQKSNKTLYFPAGIYNLNELELKAYKSFSILGDKDGGTVLLQPGYFYCYGDLKAEDLNVVDDNGVFLYLKPRGAVSVYINNVTYGSAFDFNNKSRFIHCGTDSETDYIKNVEITNCDITNVRYGIKLSCRIDKGYISGNSFSQLGNKNDFKSTGAINLGLPNSKKIFARNITISDNIIKDIVSEFSSQNDAREVQGILLYSDGGCVIENNYLENITGGQDTEGIYCKSANIKIINNTLINAGDGDGSITVKADSSKNDIIISGNTIRNDIDSTRVMSGIYITSSRFTISDNTIVMKSGIGINKGMNSTVDAVITGNTFEINGRTGIYLNDITGKALISGNKITQDYKSDEKLDGAINISAGAEAVIKIYDNELIVKNTRVFNSWKHETGVKVDIYNNIIETGGKYSEKNLGLTFAEVYDNTVK